MFEWVRLQDLGLRVEDSASGFSIDPGGLAFWGQSPYCIGVGSLAWRGTGTW